MVHKKTIDSSDRELFLFTDSVEEAIIHLEKYAVEGFKLKRRKRIKPKGILGELKMKYVKNTGN